MNPNGIGWAVKKMVGGERVTRPGWNGAAMWLALVPGVENGEASGDAGGTRERQPWIGMRTADNKWVPWAASQSDLLAVDWMLVE